MQEKHGGTHQSRPLVRFGAFLPVRDFSTSATHPNEPCASGLHPRPTRQGLSGTGGWPPISGRWAIEVERVKSTIANSRQPGSQRSNATRGLSEKRSIVQMENAIQMNQAGLAQMVEQRFCKPFVVGSIPASGTKYGSGAWF